MAAFVASRGLLDDGRHALRETDRKGNLLTSMYVPYSDARTVGLRPRTLPPLHDQAYPLLVPVPHHTTYPSLHPCAVRVALAGALRREFVFPTSKRLGRKQKVMSSNSGADILLFFFIYSLISLPIFSED